MTDLHDKTFLKQGAVSLIGKVGRTKGRWYRNVGLGIKTPRDAIEGTYIDKKCPFTGNVSVRGRIFRGIVVSTKMTRTVIVRRDYLHFQRKYKRFEKRHRNIPAHVSPAFRLRDGDLVTIAQTRPTSKTKRFTVVQRDSVAPSSDGKKVFAGM